MQWTGHVWKVEKCTQGEPLCDSMKLAKAIENTPEAVQAVLVSLNEVQYLGPIATVDSVKMLTEQGTYLTRI